MNLKPKFKRVDDLRAKLAAAEAELKAECRNFSFANGFKAVLRPEQVRSMIDA